MFVVPTFPQNHVFTLTPATTSLKTVIYTIPQNATLTALSSPDAAMTYRQVFLTLCWVRFLALLSSALGPLRGPYPCCMVLATVVIDKVNTVAERTQKEEKMLLEKKYCRVQKLGHCIEPRHEITFIRAGNGFHNLKSRRAVVDAPKCAAGLV